MTAPKRLARLVAVLCALAVSPTAGAVDFEVVVSLEASPDEGSTLAQRYEEILQDFADAVFDSTEGAHRITTVRVHTGSAAQDRADVIWLRRGQPMSSLDGIGRPGHIYMVDTFTGGAANGGDLDLVDDPDEAGPTAAGAELAHEWAHYAYGLLDEHSIQAGDVAVVPSLMHSPWNASLLDNTWRNFSIAGPGTTKTGTGDFEDTGATAHHRAYGRSAWDLLTAPPDVEALLTAPIPGAPSRTFYDDLVGPPTTAIPLVQGPAPAVQVVWEQPCSSFVIAVDNSGSMTGQHLSDAKSVASLLVDLVGADRTRLSLLTFSDSAITRVSSTLVSDEGNAGETSRDLFHDAVDQIAALPAVTSFSAGLAAGLPLFGDCSASTDTAAALFFISDGTNGPTDTVDADIADYAAEGRPIYVLDVSSFAPDATSNEMTPLVTGTGGVLQGPTAAFNQARQAILEAEGPIRSEQMLEPLPGEPDSFTVRPGGPSGALTFTVDESLDRLSICAFATGEVERLELTAPGDFTIFPVAARQTDPDVPGDDCSFFWGVDLPEAGEWSLSGIADDDATADVEIFAEARGQSSTSATTLQAWLSNGGGSPVVWPEPIHVSASLGRDLPLLGARIEAQLDGGDPVLLRDDGQRPDSIAGDGIYVASLAWDGDGTRSVQLTARNSLGIAAFSGGGLLRAPNIGGRLIPPEDSDPLVGPLLRFEELLVETTGTGMAPTHLADTTALNGRVSSSGEANLFTVDLSKIDEVEDEGDPGKLEVRISGALLGMVPRLRVYNGDPAAGAELIDEETAPPGSAGVTVPVLASDGDTDGIVYALVTHAGGGTGTYQISAGARLGLDFGTAGPSDSPCALALADKNAALVALRDGISGVDSAIVLIEESRLLEYRMIAGIRALGGAAGVTGRKTRVFLQRAANRDGKALKKLRKHDRKQLRGARRKIKNARRRLQKACVRLPDGGASLLP
jgi:calcium-activated chloride channel regulator 4